jgi:predicted transcriptional regulator
MPRLNRQHKKIIRELYRAQRPLSTNKVADRAEMSWNTADKYLEELEEMNKVIELQKGEDGGKTVWILDVDRDR